MKRLLLPFSFMFFFSLILNSQDLEYSVFDSHRGANRQWIAYKNNEQALYNVILNEALNLLKDRKLGIKELHTKQDWENYQKIMRNKMFSSLSKFEKTPLNAKTTGTLKRENFVVEKVLFESHPGFYVTAGLFIPKNLKKPAPAVIYCSGHTDLGFRSETYQRVIINLVEKGFVVFAFDPIGQGERLQYVNPETNKSKIGGSTKEHSFAGVQTLLTGISISDYFIWDGVRAVDYLETREEVDASRIGITGRSGGGTQSALIAAYDERIYAAAPECYITNFTKLLQSIGPQDAEQNPWFAIKKGFDHPDFLHLRAPKPSIIVTTTHDFFSQQGARETFEEVQKSYTAFGKPENIQFTEDFGVHESTKGNRETVYAFFQNHLKLPGNPTDNKIEPFATEELWVTETGQIGTLLQGKTVFDLNREYYSKQELTKQKLKEKIKELSGCEFDGDLTSAVYTGKIKTENFDVKKYFLENDKHDFALPVYLIENTEVSNKNLIWLFPEGKKEMLENPHLKSYLNQGYRVISIDLPGTGELFDAEFTGDGFVKGVPFNYTFGANLAGKSIPGIQAEAIDLAVQFIQNEFPDSEIHAISEREASTALLVYASQKDSFSKLNFNKAFDFNSNFIETEYYDPEKAYHIVPGSLSFFDFDEAVRKLKLPLQ